MIGNGTRQGGVLSPYLFTRYVRPLISIISQSRIGCNIGGLFVNILAYADDMALLAPSWYAMQEFLKILEYCCVRLDILCNTKKTVCMIFKPKQKDKWITDNFPEFTFDGYKLRFVSQFKYLGHVINDRLNDDDDIQRQIKNLFVRTNMLPLHMLHIASYCAIVTLSFTVFVFKKFHELEMGVKGHSRSLRVLSFDRLCMVSY